MAVRTDFSMNSLEKVGLLLCAWLLCSHAQTEQTVVTGAGATFPQPIYSEWAFAYELVHPSVRIDYDPVGSGSGKTRIKSYSVDFAGSDSPLSQADYNESPDLQMYPMLAGAVVPNYNLPTLDKTTDSLVLDRDVLADIFMGNILYWNDTRIAASNPEIQHKLPNETIIVVVRKDKSGTTDQLTSALSSFSTQWNQTYGVFEAWPQSLLNMSNYRAATGSFGVYATVQSTPNALGYLSLSFVLQDRAPYAFIRTKDNQILTADAEHVSTAMDSAEFNDKFVASIVDLPGSWPISGFTYIVLHTQNDTACERRREMMKWFHWILTDPTASSRADNEGYAPLSPNLSQRVLDKLAEVQCEGKSLLRKTQINQFGSLQITFIVISALLLTSVIAIVALFISASRSKIFKATGYFFMGMTLGGAFLNFIAVIFWGLVPSSTAVCQLRLWFTALGFSVLLAGMLAKSWEIHKIFRKSKRSVRDLVKLVAKPEPWKMMTTSAILISCQLVILVIWAAADTWKAVKRSVDSINLTEEWVCQCESPWAGFGAEIVYFALLILWGLYLAYVTQGLKANYNESRLIVFSIYNLLVCLAIVVPFLASGQIEADYQYYAVGLGILFPTTFNVLILYGPKLKKIIKMKITGRSSTESTSANSAQSNSNIRSTEFSEFSSDILKDPRIEVSPKYLRKSKIIQKTQSTIGLTSSQERNPKNSHKDNHIRNSTSSINDTDSGVDIEMTPPSNDPGSV